MEQLFLELGKWGFQGALIAVLCWQYFSLVNKVVSVVENNTEAVTKLKEHCNSVKKNEK